MARQKDGSPRAIRFRVPRSGATKFEDVVFGPREVQNAEIEDFVLLRSNGLPTYQLSVVVDDIDMRITHVIRGADHLSNTPKQALLYQALGAPVPPVFAHVPLILGPDRTRLSKRHGATSVGSYADEGFLPEAFRNFLALLGWSPGNDLGVSPHAGAHRAVRALRRQPHERGFRSREAGMVQHSVSAEAAGRGAVAIRRGGTEARRIVAGSVGWRGGGVVRASGRFDSPAHTPARRFYVVGPGIFHRRFRLRDGSPREILEG